MARNKHRFRDWLDERNSVDLEYVLKRQIRQIIELLLTEKFITATRIRDKLNIGYDKLVDLMATDYFNHLYKKYIKDTAKDCIADIKRDTREKLKGVDVRANRRKEKSTSGKCPSNAINDTNGTGHSSDGGFGRCSKEI